MKTTMLVSDEIMKSGLPPTLKVVHPSSPSNQESNQAPKMPLAKQAHFSFDRSFQEKIVQAMIMDRVWASQIAEVLKVDFFEYGFLKKIASSYLEYNSKYKEFPSIELLATITASELKSPADEAIRSQVKDFLVRVSEHKDLGDLGYVKEKSLDFCKRVGLQKALEQSIDFIETEKYEKVVETIKKAIAAGMEHSSGLDLTADVDARYSETYRRTVGTGVPELDQRKILNGGLGAGEIGVVIAATGCHAKGTEILMYDGSLRKVEDVRPGDLLMGPDSKARKVLSLVRGQDKMYKIVPVKGDSFTVNQEHILSLRRTNTGAGSRKDGEIVNISVKDYLKTSKTFKHLHKLYRVGVEFAESQSALPIDPYMLGVLLGDGSLSRKRIEVTTADPEISSELKTFAESFGVGLSKHEKKNNAASGWYFTNKGKHRNPLVGTLDKLGLIDTKSNTKFIPMLFKTASRNERLKLLAGLLDTDGSYNHVCFDYVSKSKLLADDVAYVCRSLGLAAQTKETTKSDQHGTVGTYYRVCISGDVSEIPTRIARKKAATRRQKKSVLVTGFSVVEQPKDSYYGFQVSGDHLYLMGDFTVTHNCGKSHVLTHFGAQALLRGKNVLHYTFELNERAIGIRYDSHLLDINSLDCIDNREAIKAFYAENAETLGHLRIKYYPTGGATVNTLRSHIDKLATEGFVPDLLIVDYAGIMRSTEKYDLLRLELKKIYEELRGFANELDIPVWTASQSNKEGADKDYVDLTNMAEAYGQAHVADFVIGLSRKSMNKSTGLGNIFIAKNRAGVDGLQFQIILDTARSRLKILTESEAAGMQQDAELLEDGNLKNFLRTKIRDYQKRQ